MLQGCISLGNIKCDECHGLIAHSEQYLIVVGAEGEKTRLCMACSLKEGYAHYKETKKEQVLTFFPDVTE